MYMINGREVNVHADVNSSFTDWDEMFAEAYVDYAEWADTGEEFTEAEYDEHEEFLNSIPAGEIYWDQVV